MPIRDVSQYVVISEEYNLLNCYNIRTYMYAINSFNKIAGNIYGGHKNAIIEL